VVITGPSGAGKSTPANCLNGLITNFTRGKYSRSVNVLGKDPAKEKVGAMAKDVGPVFQDLKELARTSEGRYTCHGINNLIQRFNPGPQVYFLRTMVFPAQ